MRVPLPPCYAERPRCGARTGVRMVTGVEAGKEAAVAPWWAAALGGFGVLGGDDLPPGFASGCRFTAPMVEMSRYLEYLAARFVSAGGRLEQGHVRSLGDVVAAAPRIINCTGMGARELVQVDRLRPIRGQMVLIEKPRHRGVLLRRHRRLP